MAYQNAWEWPVVIAHASALIAGGWTRILRPNEATPRSTRSDSGISPPPPTTDMDEGFRDVSPAPP